METIPTSEMPTQIALIILRFRIMNLWLQPQELPNSVVIQSRRRRIPYDFSMLDINGIPRFARNDGLTRQYSFFFKRCTIDSLPL